MESMKLEDMTPSERKVLKSMKGEELSATEISNKSKVTYTYVRPMLTYLKKLGMVEHRGDAHYGTWVLSEKAKTLFESDAQGGGGRA